ncbi:MAG TPA: ATPase, T2SS/T4P/T4SS family [Abditibacterium sp.]|jgi:type IV pilus assembly protein PilB
MKNDIWAFLGLEKAKLRDFGRGDDQELQPAPLKLAFPDLNEAPSSADDWRGEEPVARIVNTILLCAVRDGASAIAIEPQNRNVRVYYTIKGRVREHITLPTLALEPVVAHFKRLAQIEIGHNSAQWGSLRLRVDGRFYDLHVQTHITQWGERVEMRFSVVV